MSLADDLAGIRLTIDAFQLDTATITRTGARLSCKVADGKRDLHMDGIPPFLRLHQWNVQFPDGSDVQSADLATVTGKAAGSYTLLGLIGATTLSVSTTMTACRTDLPDSRIVTNATVTFIQKGAEARLPGIPATIGPLSLEEHAQGMALGFTHTVIWKDVITFPNGAPVLTGDLIEYTPVPGGTIRQFSLQKPRRWTLPYPVAQAAFSETT